MNYQVEAKNPSRKFRKFRGRPGRGSRWRNRYPFTGGNSVGWRNALEQSVGWRNALEQK
jgi:hypothetical protein